MASRPDAAAGAPPREGEGAGAAPLLRLRGVEKRYGHTQALAGADLEVRPGEIVGIVGHNGAGKSTLMRVVAGITAPDAGTVEVDGRREEAYGPAAARDRGIRMVFQELSLCPSLRVFENVLVSRPGLAGRGWRPRARRLIARQLDEVFPGHGISPWRRVESLPLAQRQVVEIAQATLGEGDVRLVVLDEPTSALPGDAAASLFRYLERRREEGISFILITHRIAEVLDHTDRVFVMRDGQVVAVRRSRDVSEDDLVGLMGGAALAAVARRGGLAEGERHPAVEVEGLTTRRLRGVTLVAHRGEIVGLAGLEGQGQQELLFELWRRRRQRRRGLRVHGRLAFVSGDRREAGVFPLWPLSLNLTVGSVGRRALVSRRAERELAGQWMERLAVRGRPGTPILDLSGGNQQKVLIARALGAGADVVLLDDPFRGVDVGTRRDTYRLLRDEAAAGRCILWFSTENAELEQCDRVYVLREGAVVAELAGDEISEEQLIAAAFQRPAEVVR
jgi:ribose transport system ATP-binding protein